MYNPRPQKEPSGCLQTLIITRIILQILFLPLMLVAGGVAGVILFFFALTVNPLLGLLVLAMVGVGLYFFGRWEARRESAGVPPPKDPY
jgi:hypothetical protein